MSRMIRKSISILTLLAVVLSTTLSSCKSAGNNQNDAPKRNTSGELIYDEFDSENIMLLNNETVFIKDVDKNHKFSFYSENEYDTVKIYDSSQKEFKHKVKHYDVNYNFNMYLIDFDGSEYSEGMNYTIDLPSDNDFFLIKDIEKVYTITFTIKTDTHDKAEYVKDVDFNKTYTSIDEVGDLPENEVALVETDEGIVPYILSEDGKEIVKAKFSDVYKSVDLYSTGNLLSETTIEENKDLLFKNIKQAIVNSDFYRSLFMTTYAEGVEVDYDNINVKVESINGDNRVEATIEVESGHTLTISTLFNISYESNVIIKDTTGVEETLDFDNIDFAISLNVKEFTVKDVLTISGEKQVEDASQLISNEDKKNFLKALDLTDKAVQSSTSDLLPPIVVPLGCGFFVKGNVPFEAVFNYDGSLTTTVKLPCHAKSGFRFDKKTKSFQPYQDYDYSVDVNINGEIKIKSHVGIGVKATLYALNEDFLSVHAGAVVKLHNDDEFMGNLSVSKANKNANVTDNYEFTGHIKVYLTIDVYGGALISTKPIPIIGQLFGYEINPKFEKEIYSKIIFEKDINYVKATVSEAKRFNEKESYYCIAIDYDTVIVTKHRPDEETYKELQYDIRQNVMMSEGKHKENRTGRRDKVKRIIINDQLELTSLHWMFGNYHNELEEVINLKYLFSDKTENVSRMFDSSGIKEVDLRGCNFSSVKDMSCMFANCRRLQRVNISGLDLSNVYTMREMFFKCEELEEVTFNGVKTKNLIELASMFSYCKKLKKVDLTGFDFTTVYSKYSGMVSNDEKNSFGMNNMFDDCVELEKIYVSSEPNVERILNKTTTMGRIGMFINCNKLIGGNGSTLAALKEKYDKYQDYHFAVIDNELHEGLFTKK